jgi:imidazolonepropionase-like amidohydrolase
MGGLYPRVGENAPVQLAITDVTVLDMTGAPPRPDHVVLVDDGVVGDVGPSEKVALPPGAEIVPGEAGWLIPGLWDMHVHIRDPDHDLGAFLGNGVVGVRDMGGHNPDNPPQGSFGVPWSELRVIRDGIRANRWRGPDVVAAGVMLDAPDPWPGTLGLPDPATARRTIRELAAEDVDFIKVGTGITPTCYEAVLDEATRLGLEVVGHVPAKLTAVDVAERGQRSLEHVMGLPSDCFADGAPGADCRLALQRLASTGAWATPTLVAWQATLADEDAHTLHTLVNAVGLMHRAGVPILAGSDCGVPGVAPGRSLHEELRLLVQAGLSAEDALAAATVGPARFQGRVDTSGTIETGKRADLVLLDGDPLADIGNVSRISAVFQRGEKVRP